MLRSDVLSHIFPVFSTWGHTLALGGGFESLGVLVGSLMRLILSTLRGLEIMLSKAELGDAHKGSYLRRERWDAAHSTGSILPPAS